MLWTRYTLRYITPEGRRITLYNLMNEGRAYIERVQSALGSRDFQIEVQPHNYSQQELDLLRKGNV